MEHDINEKLENLINDAKNKKIPISDFLINLVSSNLALPSGTEIMSNGDGFQPLLFQKEKTQMIACFTDLEKPKKYAEQAPFCLLINGLELLKRIPDGFGLVINPGFENGMDLSATGIKKIIADFGH